MVARRISFVQETVYGRMSTMVSGELDHSDTAYTSLPLGAHNDLTYFALPAGLVLWVLLYSCLTAVVSDNYKVKCGWFS